VNQSPPLANSADAVRSPFWRFSLLTLLSVTTLAGFVSAIVFSPHWHFDERLLLAFWCAGLILGVSFGKARRSQGVLSGVLGGAVGCVIAAMIVLNRFEQLPEGAARNSTVYLVFVVTVGSLAALLVAGGYQFVASGRVERVWESKRARRITLLALGGLASGLIAWQLLRPQPWRPSWEIDLRAKDLHDNQSLRLSPTGQFLFVHKINQKTNYRFTVPAVQGFVFELTPRGVIGGPTMLAYRPTNYVLSPDCKRIAVSIVPSESSIESWRISQGLGKRNTGPAGLSISDSTDWMFPRYWKWQADAETATFLKFNATSDRLLVTTHTPRIQRLYVVDPTQDKLPQPELFPFAGRLLLDPTGEVLLKIHDPAEADGPRRVEVVRRRDGRLLGEMHDVPVSSYEHYLNISPVISPGGDYLAQRGTMRTDQPRVWNRNGKSTAMPGNVVAFTGDGRAIVHRTWQRQAEWLPAWLLPMPFVRHAHEGKSFFGQMLLVDLVTGETQIATPAFKHMVIAQAAEQGTVVLGGTYPEEYVRIWKVPPRQ
jgi:hypothetical protein